jgi:hypothetical protein
MSSFQTRKVYCMLEILFIVPVIYLIRDGVVGTGWSGLRVGTGGGHL